MEIGIETPAHTTIAAERSCDAGSVSTSVESQLLRYLADLSPVGILQADVDGRFIYANTRWCQMAGCTDEVAPCCTWMDYVHPDDVYAVREAWTRMREYGVPFSAEFRYVTMTGSDVWVCSQAMELRDGRGRLVGYLATASDITEVRRMREEVQRCRVELETQIRGQMIEWEQTAMIIASSADAIISCDLTGRVASWNHAAERIFGYLAAYMIGRTTQEITPADRAEEATAIKQRVMKGERIDHFETVGVASSGEMIEVAMSIFPLEDPSGIVTGTCAVMRDVREQKEAERRLRQLSGRLLRVQDEERRRLARELHDSTAQSLAALSVNLSLLSKHGDQLSEEKRASLLADSVALADGVGRDLRTHAYLLHPPMLEECGLTSALRWLADGFAQRSGIAVKLLVPPDLPRLNELVELTIFRVVQESLANIHRHTKSPSAEIRLEKLASEITLEVRDAGGVAPSDKSGQEGVGIAGMRERLAQVGGTLIFTYHPDGSTVFAPDPARMNTEIKTRILLVDDHEIVRRGLRTLLEMRPDWTICAEAADGRSAVHLAEELSPDLIILDLSMPELNGLEAARRIVSRNARSRVLILTMHETEQFVRESLSAGARGYILKTDAGRDLIAAVEALLRGETFFTSRLAATIYAAEFEGVSRRRRPRSESQLTPREREILQLLVEGRKNRDVGRVLNISVKTAETHRARIMSKLGLDSVADLVRYAIRNGLIAP